MSKRPEKPDKRHRNRKRWLSYADELLRMRVRAVCDHLFGGDIKAFGAHFNIKPQRVRQIFTGKSVVTVKVVAEILTKSSVRTDWLLWGNGQMLDCGGALDEKPGTLVVPDAVCSSFPVFDTAHSNSATKDFVVTSFIPLERNKKKIAGAAQHAEVARAIHRCRSADKHVLFIIGPDAISAGAGMLVNTMLQKKYVTAVATTGAGVLQDLQVAKQDADLNYIAQLAAKQGIGYGEAVGRWGFTPKQGQRDNSLFYTAHTLGIPATVHVELGEIPNHLFPAARGAEIGAAIGAATYVDFLVFTAIMHDMHMSGGGVVIMTGDVSRRMSTLLLRAGSAIVSVPAPDLTLVAIDVRSQHYSDAECENLRLRGDKKHILPGLYRGTVYKLIETCDAVFSGKTTHAIEQS